MYTSIDVQRKFMNTHTHTHVVHVDARRRDYVAHVSQVKPCIERNLDMQMFMHILKETSICKCTYMCTHLQMCNTNACTHKQVVLHIDAARYCYIATQPGPRKDSTEAVSSYGSSRKNGRIFEIAG